MRGGLLKTIDLGLNVYWVHDLIELLWVQILYVSLK